CGIGVVFAAEHKYARLLIVFVRNVDRLDDIADHPHRIVLEGDDALGTRAHAHGAAAAPGRLRKRICLFVLVDRAERTLFRTPLALSAALHEEFRVAQVTGPGMNRHALAGEFDALDGLHGGTGSVLDGV